MQGGAISHRQKEEAQVDAGTVPFTMRMPVDLKADLERLAEQKDTTLSRIIRRSIRRTIDEELLAASR